MGIPINVWQLKVVAAAVLLCFSVCNAEVVKGTVTDSTLSQAIANVLVQEAGTGNVTLTDDHGGFTLEINAAIVRPRDGKSPNNPAPEPSAPAILSRKGGYATRWTSVALCDTNITVQLVRELEAVGPSAALFANPCYVCRRNFYVAPPPTGNDANDGTSPQSPWATLTKANVGRATVPNYMPSAMDNYWAPFHIVSAYNVVQDNYGIDVGACPSACTTCP
jgi:hypothetical protein